MTDKDHFLGLHQVGVLICNMLRKPKFKERSKEMIDISKKYKWLRPVSWTSQGFNKVTNNTTINNKSEKKIHIAENSWQKFKLRIFFWLVTWFVWKIGWMGGGRIWFKVLLSAVLKEKLLFCYSNHTSISFVWFEVDLMQCHVTGQQSFGSLNKRPCS